MKDKTEDPKVKKALDDKIKALQYSETVYKDGK